MKNGSFDKDALISKAASSLGISPDKLRSSMDGKSQDELLKSLSPSDAAAIKKLMADPKALDAFMNSPQARELLRMLMGK